jgi:hypothetical protein
MRTTFCSKSVGGPFTSYINLRASFNQIPQRPCSARKSMPLPSLALLGTQDLGKAASSTRCLMKNSSCPQIGTCLHPSSCYLLSKSSMRACTATVTEISWNSSNDKSQKYRAEIEFIEASDWENDLKILQADLLDPRGQV